jgi:hypothetical protein
LLFGVFVGWKGGEIAKERKGKERKGQEGKGREGKGRKAIFVKAAGSSIFICESLV